jgi:aspartate/methionine/tyrosine aminotransferase
VQELCAVVAEEYGGDAERVWTEAEDAADLRRRIGALPGFGKMKIVGLGSVLALRFGVEHARELVPPVVAGYRERRDVVVEGFRSLGWEIEPPRATMFVWLPVPEGFSSQQWTMHLIDEASVVVTPGNAFGPGGEGFFRVSLVGEPSVLREAIARMKKAGIRFEQAR